MTEEEPTPKAPKPISMDDLYRRSTQFQMWSFTQSGLEELRQKTHENGRLLARSKFEDVHAQYKQENPSVFDAHSEELSVESLLDVLTFDEERKYLSFYAKNIIQAANFFRMPTQVKATAILFFKKFYLLNSVMKYYPKNILYACLFLAAKSENYFISIESFCKALQKTEPKDILDLEFIVLQDLKFTLFVHHPFRPLHGFYLDFQQVLEQKDLGSLYDGLKKWLNDYALLSDVEFLFTPPQIALAAMYDTDRELTTKYLTKKFGHTRLLEVVEKCIEVGKTSNESSREDSTRIDKKCYYLTNPGKLIGKKVKKLGKPETEKIDKETEEGSR